MSSPSRMTRRQRSSAVPTDERSEATGTNDLKNLVKMQMLRSFDTGNGERFVSLWKKYLSLKDLEQNIDKWVKIKYVV